MGLLSAFFTKEKGTPLYGNHAFPFVSKTVVFSWNSYRDPSQDIWTMRKSIYFLEVQMNYLAQFSYLLSVLGAIRCYMLA